MPLLLEKERHGKKMAMAMKTTQNAGEIKVKLKKFYELFLHAAGPRKRSSRMAGKERKILHSHRRRVKKTKGQNERE